MTFKWRKPALSLHTYLGELCVLCFLLTSQFAHFVDAGPQPARVANLLFNAIEPQALQWLSILCTLGKRAERLVCTHSRHRAQMVLIESHREGIVGRQNKLGITLSPVLHRGCE